MQNVNQWYETQFLPWKKAVEAYTDDQNKMLGKVREYSAELKYMVSLLLEKREGEAVKVWNDLEFQPQLKGMNLDLSKDALTLVSKDGGESILSLDVLLEELQEMLA